MKYIIIIFLAIISPALLIGQTGETKSKESIKNAWLIFAGFGFNQKAEDLNDRFGFGNSASLSVEHFWGKSKLFTGITGHYGFGSEIKEDVLAGLRTPQGDIIGSNNSLASVFLRERHWHTGHSGRRMQGG